MKYLRAYNIRDTFLKKSLQFKVIAKKKVIAKINGVRNSSKEGIFKLDQRHPVKNKITICKEGSKELCA